MTCKDKDVNRREHRSVLGLTGRVCDSGEMVLVFELNWQSNYISPFRASEATC